MTAFGRFLLFAAAMVVTPAGRCPAPARAQTQRVGKGLTPITPSGATVVRAVFPKGSVVAKIHTTELAGACASACPTSRWVLKSYHARQAVVVSDLSISINGRAVDVPPPAYELIYDPIAARLEFDRGRFILKIYGNADGASTGYFDVMYFTVKGVNERREYLQIDEQQPLVVMHFYTVTLGP